jgi:hypothetical protein
LSNSAELTWGYRRSPADPGALRSLKRSICRDDKKYSIQKIYRGCKRSSALRNAVELRALNEHTGLRAIGLRLFFRNACMYDNQPQQHSLIVIFPHLGHILIENKEVFQGLYLYNAS